MRPIHICFDQIQNHLFASTNRGTILKFDQDLNPLQSSEPVYGLNNLFVCTVDDEFIFARDIAGKLVRWKKSNLSLDAIVDLCVWNGPEDADVPNVSHGLFIHGEAVYVSMPQGPMGKFDRKTFQFLGLSTYRPTALLECFDLSQPEDHFAVDFSGYLYRGHIDRDMKKVARIANGACHQVIYDQKFDRYWVTDDYHCGLALFKANDPKNITRIPLTRDDVEWMSFNKDQSEVLVACFDRYIYRIQNDLEPRVVKTYGPFKYQVNHVEWVSDDLAYALTESGEIYRVQLDSGEFIQGPTGTNAVWDIKALPTGENHFVVAFEDGFLRQVEVTDYGLNTVQEKNLRLGMIRRVVAVEDGYFVLTTGGHVARLNCSFEIIWLHETKPLLRDLARHSGRIFYCGETGELAALNEQTGQVLWRKNFDRPLWALSVDPSGQEYFLSSRLCEHGDQGQESSGRPTYFVCGDTSTGEELRRHPIFGNIKRIQWTPEHKIVINGNGEASTTLMDPKDFSILRQWSDWQLNTCEAVLQLGDRLFTTTYGYQLNTYSTSGEILESAFPFEDYSTSLVAVDENRFLAGGRGAFLSLFKIQGGLPVLISLKRYNHDLP